MSCCPDSAVFTPDGLIRPEITLRLLANRAQEIADAACRATRKQLRFTLPISACALLMAATDARPARLMFELPVASDATVAAVGAITSTPNLASAVLAKSESTGPHAIRLASGILNTDVLTTTPRIAGSGMQMLQFKAEVQSDWYAQLSATGVTIVSYLPDNAYLVAGNTSQLQALAEFAAKASFVQWLGEYKSEYKLHPTVKAAIAAAPEKPLASPNGVGEKEFFVVQLLRGVERNVLTRSLLTRFQLSPPINQYDVLKFSNIVVQLDPQDLVEIARQPDVVFIEKYVEPTKLDERQNQIIAGNLTGNGPTPGNYMNQLATWGFNQAQFTASGFGVDVSDSGVDNATTAPNHFGLRVGGNVSGASRVVYNRLVGTANAGSTLQGCDGHGNLNTHIIGGNVGTRSSAPHADASGFRYGMGVAPFVRVGASVIFDPNAFTNPNFPNLQSQAYNDNMRISSNSWGAANGGAYTTDSQAYDALVRDAQPTGSTNATAGNQEMVILFSAGNSGPGVNTIGSPGTGKNVITVGASEGVQAFGGADGCNIADTGADSANDVISFSSRGPTDDGRIKREILAPGTHITGGVFQAAAIDTGTGAAGACYTGDGVCGGVASNFFPSAGQQFYTASSGTSHSTPALAGGAALLRQYFINGGLAPPSPAMTKAYLTNTARYMTGVSANDNLFSNNQGMGMLNLGMAFDAAARQLRDQTDSFTSTGQSLSYNYVVADASKPLRISLAWTDVPGTPAAQGALVNNLDLVVQVGSTVYRGNVFSGASSATGGTADSKNNLESVFLPAGTAAGTTVNITISALSIAGDGIPGNAAPLDQDFALVAYNAAPGGPNMAPTIAGASVNVTQGGTVNDVIANVTDDGGNGAVVVTLGASANVSINTVVNNFGTVRANVAASCTAPIGAATVGLTATDIPGLTATSSLGVSIGANAAPTLGSYSNATALAGLTTTFTPAAPPADTGATTPPVLTVSATGGLATLSINQTTGLVTLTTATPIGGPYTVTVRATDACGLFLEQTFQVTVNPNVVPIAAGTSFISGSCTLPSNTVVDPGEYVTLGFALQNTGTTNPSNLVATLQSNANVAAVSAPQNYGALAGGGAAVTQNFSFLATGTCGTSIAATLQLQDGATNYGTVNYTINLGAPATSTQSNTGNILVPGTGTGAGTGAPANPYPATLNVSGLPTTIASLTATLTGINHTFPDDIDVILVSPAGQKVLLMSDAGGTLDLVNVNLTFDDAAAASLPDTAQIVSGSYKPSNFGTGADSFPAPAPAAPYAGTMSTFNGSDPNGIWSLYVVDDLSGDSGNIAGGFSLTITTTGGTCAGGCTLGSFSVANASATEGNIGSTPMTFTVTRTAGVGTQTVDITSTAGGSATAGIDYTALSATTLTFGVGVTTQTATVSVLGDVLDEADETFNVSLSNASGGASISTANAVGTITDDDAAPSISINAPSVTEGVVPLNFVVSLSSASGLPVSFNAATANGTALAGSDYTALASTAFTIPAGNTSITIPIAIVNDSAVELTEAFALNLSAISNANVTSLSGIGTIVDDDTRIFISDASVSEGNAGTTNLTFTVTRNSNLIGFTFQASTTGLTASSGVDFVEFDNILSFAAGGPLSQTFNVLVNGDTAIEADETLRASLGLPSSGVTVQQAFGTGTIVNDDFPVATITVTPASVLEDGVANLVYTLSFDQAALSPVTVALNTTGSAASGVDYTGALASLIIPTGSQTGTITIDPTADAVAEANESVILTIASGSGYTMGGANATTGTITNDDSAGVALVQSGGTTDVAEGGATDTYTLVLTSQPTNNVSIALNPGTQVTVATSPVVFTTANWNVAQTVTVTAVDDVLVEGPHTGTISHTVTSSDATYNAFAVANVVANITDNDLPTLAINDVSISVGNACTSALNFTVTRTGTTPSAVGFNFATGDGTATTADSDYVAATGTGTIPSGGATGTTTVSVTINGDAIFENNDSFFINLTAPTNASISDNQGVATITNDDTAPTLAINDVSIVEGNSGTQNMVFTVTRTGLTALPASFTAATANGTATAPSDYLAALTGSTTIAAGGATGTTTLTATINGDLTIEPNENFTVDLSAPVNATILDGQGLGTITNDDGAPSYTPAAAIMRQQGSATAVATLGTVSDLTDPTNSLTVALIAGGTATGVTATGLSNNNGTVTASLAASCTAASGTLRLQVTDSGSLTGTGDVQVNVTPNTPPSLAYSSVNIGVGNGASQNPSSGLSDNGSVTNVSILSAGTYAGVISVSSIGTLSLSNATPAGNHSITVRATDNCGANTDAIVQVLVAQANSFKEVTSNVSPSRFGQAVTLSAQLVGVNPTGSVEFFAGSTSLGSSPLTASPSGGNNLKLATLTTSALPVGNSSITVRYLGDVNNLPSTSSILPHAVLGADTVMTLTPAANPAAIGSTSFGVQVQAIAPGSGVPAGSVTLSAGPGISCVATLSAGSGSCALNFTAAGFFPMSANYAPTNANFLTSTASAALVVVSTPSSTDLRVRIGNGVRNIGTGSTVRYDIVVDNLGAQAAVGRLQAPLSADYASSSFSCVSSGNASCGSASSGTGSIDKEVSLAPGGAVIFSLTVTAPINPERVISQGASITVKTPTTDSDSSNDQASDIDPMGLLSDGYEDFSASE